LLSAVKRTQDEAVFNDVIIDSIDVEFISLFIILHIPDSNSRVQYPAKAYDTLRPFAEANDPLSNRPQKLLCSPTKYL